MNRKNKNINELRLAMANVVSEGVQAQRQDMVR
jgi:hypothetical protein